MNDDAPTAPSNTAPRLASLDEILAARERLQNAGMATPLIPLNARGARGQIHLKLENLQPIGSFKTRPVANIILSLTDEERERGVFTASSGNAGIAVAFVAAELGLAADVVVPKGAPGRKLSLLASLGARVHTVPPQEWWEVIMTHRWPGIEGVFIDAVGNPNAIAGSGTLGLEILEQLDEVGAIFVPFGGGGLLSGIASAVHALERPTRIVACESEAATPLRAALAAGRPVDVEPRDSFISGMGAAAVLPWMWPLLARIVDEVAVVSFEETAAAIRMLAKGNHLIAEGAGAVSVAAALERTTESDRVACVVSGGNIDQDDLITILQGGLPRG